MKRCAWLALGMLVLATGCSQQMHGTWQTVKVVPPDAAAQCGISAITLNEDGTYLATNKEQGQEKKSAGKWTYDGMNLRLVGSDGKAREFSTVVWLTKYMDATADMGGKKVTVKMEKQAAK